MRDVLDPDKIQKAFDVRLAEEKKSTRLILERKKNEPRRPLDRLREKLKRPTAEREYDLITLTLNADMLLEKIELSGWEGSREIRVSNQKYKKQWALKQVDMTTTDDEKRFDERLAITIDYVDPQGILLPSKYSFHNLEKDGKLLVRRNEANPVTVQFKNYQVEVKK